MARGRQTRRIPDRMIGLAITCVVLGMAWVRPACLESIEYQTFSLRLKQFGSRTPAQRIAIVAIDEESITTPGHRPWPSSRIAAAGREWLGMLPPVGPGMASPGTATPVGQRTVVSGDSAVQQFEA
jgi:hypothetical protein